MMLKNWKEFIQNSRGSAIIQIMGVSLTLAAGSAYVIKKLRDDKALANSARFNATVEQVAFNIESNLMDPDACENTFGGAAPGIFADIKISNNDNPATPGTETAYIATTPGAYAADDDSLIEQNTFGHSGSRFFLQQIELTNPNGAGEGELRLTFTKMLRDPTKNTMKGGASIIKRIPMSISMNGANVGSCFADPEDNHPIMGAVNEICGGLSGTTGAGFACNNLRDSWTHAVNEQLCEANDGMVWDSVNNECNYSVAQRTPAFANPSASNPYINTFITGFTSTGDYETCEVDCTNAQFVCGTTAISITADNPAGCASGMSCQPAHNTTNCPAPRNFICSSGNSSGSYWQSRRLFHKCRHQGFNGSGVRNMIGCEDVMCEDCSGSNWCDRRSPCRAANPTAWDLECDPPDVDTGIDCSIPCTPTGPGGVRCYGTNNGNVITVAEYNAACSPNIIDCSIPCTPNGNVCEEENNFQTITVAEYNNTCGANPCTVPKVWAGGACGAPNADNEVESGETIILTNTLDNADGNIPAGEVEYSCNNGTHSIVRETCEAVSGCLPQTVNWSQGGADCSVVTTQTYVPDATGSINDTTQPGEGSASIKCNGSTGLLEIQGTPTCENAATSCPSGSKTWNAGGQSCTGDIPETDTGQNGKAVTSGTGNTGEAFFTCNSDGTWSDSPVSGSEVCNDPSACSGFTENFPGEGCRCLAIIGPGSTAQQRLLNGETIQVTEANHGAGSCLVGTQWNLVQDLEVDMDIRCVNGELQLAAMRKCTRPSEPR